MTIFLPTLAVTFAAFCVWLTVRIVNRRERWAKWTAVVMVGLPVMYFASFGPACWLCQQSLLPQRVAWCIYRPLTWLAVHGRSPAREAIRSYAIAWGDDQSIMSYQFYAVRLKAPLWSASQSPIVYETLRKHD